jgi:glycosyl transferase family 87
MAASEAPAPGVASRGLFGAASPVLLAGMVAVRIVILVVTIYVGNTRPILDGDIRRFEEIGVEQGTPYRDFATEYAPVETAVIRAIAGDGLAATVTRVALLWFVCELATAAALGWAWGKATATTYLVLGLPLLTQMSLRLDPLAVALAVVGLALARKGRERAGGVVLALAALTKVWPLFLVPALLIDRRRRAAGWFAGAALVGGAAWAIVGGAAAPLQVASFRGVTGWHIESAVGLLVWILTGGPTRGELGAIRVGALTTWERVGLGAATIALLAAVWTRARRWRGSVDPLGVPAVAALAGAIVLSPVWAGHYMSWLLPWGAIAAGHREGRVTARVLFVVSILTAFVGATLDFGNWEGSGPHIPVVQAALFAIHVLLVVLVLRWLRWEPAAESAMEPAEGTGRSSPLGRAS